MKTCAYPGCENQFKPRFRTTEKFCSSECTWKDKKNKQKSKSVSSKPINKVSKKHGARLKQYAKDRKEFLGRPENINCQIQGTNCTGRGSTIEHTKGREGYGDEWARQNGVWLLNDERFWIPACPFCNTELESNPELSKKHQFSKIHNGKKI